ncbi:MAG: hypothetical protein KBC38_03145 [Candidatus Pacebacteria bacterium]|nr:hypothetical protein [Candidatus Paceibacterota bacterium]MBP9840593.1 hypothetical protein [Candidatus Paceibacterota bacterium]
MLRGSFFALVAVYIALIISTVYFAALESDLREAIHDTEASIAALEVKYFSAVDAVAKSDPSAHGLTHPAAKRYAKELPAPSVTLLAP